MLGFSGVTAHPHAGQRLKVRLDDAPHDPGNLAYLWRRGPYSYKNPRGMRKLAQYNQLCLFYVGLSYAQKKRAFLATKIDPHRLDQRNVDFEPRLNRQLTYLQKVFSCERKATAWCTVLEATDTALETNPGWQEVRQKIVLLQGWIDFLEQNQRWPELPQFCKSLSGYMPNHNPHEQNHALLSLWERDDEVKRTVDATVVFLQQVKANTALPQVSRTFAGSCLQMINYRLSKKPSRERLYIFLDMLQRILQPSFLPAEIWPIDSSLITAINTQCQQHLPCYRFHDVRLSKQDLTYIKRFLGDIIRGKYVLKNQMGQAIAFTFSSWSEESSPKPEDTISATEELANALMCSVQEVIEFARNAKGQRLLHFLQDQFNDALIACQADAFADAGHTTTTLFKTPAHGLLLRIESIGFIANLPGSGPPPALPCPFGKAA